MSFDKCTHLCTYYQNRIGTISITLEGRDFRGPFGVKSPTAQPQATQDLLPVATDSTWIF